jgi:hypothetical protein
MSDAINFREWLRARAAAVERGHGGTPETAEPVQEHRPSTDAHSALAAPRNLAFPNLRAPWRKGETGNPRGRPTASRDRLGEAFIRDLVAHYEQHGVDAIHRIWAQDPAAYLALVARLVPKDFRGADDGARSILERFGLAELAELRKQLEEAVAAARAGVPVALPPILAEEIHEDPNR